MDPCSLVDGTKQTAALVVYPRRAPPRTQGEVRIENSSRVMYCQRAWDFLRCPWALSVHPGHT